MSDATPLQYAWALDKRGFPTPISKAERGGEYICPLCRRPMLARKGTVVRHHYAHDDTHSCTPDAVSRALAGLWLALMLEYRRRLGEGLLYRWGCAICGEAHEANIMTDIADVERNYRWQDTLMDIVLLDGKNVPCTVIDLAVRERAPETDRRLWLEKGFTLITLDGNTARSGIADPELLVNRSLIETLRCPLQKEAASTGIITQHSEIKTALMNAVPKPYDAYAGTLHTEQTYTHVLTLPQNKRVWLPPETWNAVIGGTRNRLDNHVVITLQEWKDSDMSTVALYRVEIGKDDAAVGLQRFRPGKQPRWRLPSAAFLEMRVSALQLAKELVGG